MEFWKFFGTKAEESVMQSAQRASPQGARNHMPRELGNRFVDRYNIRTKGRVLRRRGEISEDGWIRCRDPLPHTPSRTLSSALVYRQRILRG